MVKLHSCFLNPVQYCLQVLVMLSFVFARNEGVICIHLVLDSLDTMHS